MRGGSSERYGDSSGFNRRKRGSCRESSRVGSRERNREHSGTYRRKRSVSRESYRSISKRSPSRRSEVQDITRELKKIGEERAEDRKLDPPPVWEESISFEAWSRSVLVWADVNVKPQRKAQLLLEMLKKDEKKKGLKEMIVSEIIENKNFDYKDGEVIKNILE